MPVCFNRIVPFAVSIIVLLPFAARYLGFQWGDVARGQRCGIQ